jgi:hypothetical protein
LIIILTLIRNSVIQVLYAIIIYRQVSGV